jgi:hypothetical protein
MNRNPSAAPGESKAQRIATVGDDARRHCTDLTVPGPQRSDTRHGEESRREAEAGGVPAEWWDAVITCQSRGCGRQEHRVCVEAAQRPADDEGFTYRCPVTRMPTGFRFGELKWRELTAYPGGSIVIRPVKRAASERVTAARRCLEDEPCWRVLGEAYKPTDGKAGVTVGVEQLAKAAKVKPDETRRLAAYLSRMGFATFHRGRLALTEAGVLNVRRSLRPRR